MTSSSLRFDHLQHQFEENPRRHFVPLANAFLHAGNAKRAVELCRTFLPQLPGHVSGHVVLAEALRTLGAADEARAEYERVLALDAENLVAVRALGDLAAARGNAMEARGWYARLVELDPRDAGAATRLDELTRAAALPIAPPYDAVSGEELDARHEAAAPEVADVGAAPFGATDQELAEEFTAGFFASVLDDTPTPRRADDDRFASDLDHLLPTEPLPGAEELHATLSAPSHPGSVPAARDALSLSSLSPFDVVEPAQAPQEGEPSAFAHDAPTDAFGATPVESPVVDGPAVESPIMEEFPEDEAAAADLAAEPGHAFVTETMAELYLRQGFRTEALDVYRQLLAASPHDERLQALVADLSRPAMATPDAPLPVVASDAALPFDVIEDAPSEPAQGPGRVAQEAEPTVEPDLELVAEPAEAEAASHVAADTSDGERASAADGDVREDEPAPSFALGSGGMIDGVAGVEDRTWAVADAPPAAAAAPTVGAWLSSLVAGEELPVAVDARREPEPAGELVPPAPTDSHVEHTVAPVGEWDESPTLVAEPMQVDAPMHVDEAMHVETQKAVDEPMEVDAPMDLDLASIVDEQPTYEQPEMSTEPAVEHIATDEPAAAWDAAPELAGAAAPGEPAYDEPTVAWVEAEPEEFTDDLLVDEAPLAAEAPTAPDAVAEPELADLPPEEPVAAVGADAAPAWPSWGADALLAEVEAAPDDAHGASDADVRDEAEFAGTVAAEPPLDDPAPLAAAGAGVAPAGDAPLAEDEIEGATTERPDAAWDDPFAWDEPGEMPVAAPTAGEPFSLDELFALPADPADERAADTLAAATAGLGEEPGRGRDATAADDASSLGALLGATPPGVPAADASPLLPGSEGPARGNTFSFEQFFRPTPAAGGHVAPSSPPPRPASEPAAERDDDLDEFHRWLEGLSKS